VAASGSRGSGQFGSDTQIVQPQPDPEASDAIRTLGPLKKLGLLVRRIVHVVARPVPQRRGLAIHPFRGYGTGNRAFLTGRVLRQPVSASVGPSGKLARDLLNLIRRALRRGAADVVVEADLSGARARATTDPDGFFQVELILNETLPSEVLWQEVTLRVPGDHGASATTQVFIAPPSSPFAVISDIDDTVVFTGVARKAAMLWNIFMQGAESRVAFPGVAAFYRALHRGPSGEERNPMLYVSRGPWSIYEVLTAFFRLHDIPEGPLLFLRDWGMTLHHPLPRRGRGHKERLIHDMLVRYSDFPFVLIGDSGQKDPEKYAQLVRDHPGRILAVYIRNVSRDPSRDTAIQALAREVRKAGSEILLADDSFIMARHAAEHGLISSEALAEVLEERASVSPHASL
jgi:phosphatidate phosphatase APP1